MKKIFSLLLAGSLVFGVSVNVNAQPPEPTLIEYPSQNFLNSIIDDFYRSFNTRYANFESTHVEGLKPDSKELGEVCRIIVSRLGSFSMESTNANYSVNPQNPNLITVNFTLNFDDYGLNFHIAQADQVVLKRHDDNNVVQWLIVPSDPQKYFDSPIVDLHTKSELPISGITESIATLVAFPEELLPIIHLHQSMSQLKSIGFAMIYFLQDYDGQFAFTAQNFREKLSGYTRNESVFTAPGDNSGVTSYDVNLNILGVPNIESYDNKDVVAFYLGHNQKLDFRYNGKSVVCFMDGHVEAISPEEAKDLQWKP